MKKTREIKILISDDNPVIRKLLRKILQFISNDFIIKEASDGAECVDKLLEFKPDLLLLDLLMPKINGLKILQKMTREKLFEITSVMVISGLEDKDSIALINCMRFGASDFIYKPFKRKLIVYKMVNQVRNIIIRQNLFKMVEKNNNLRKNKNLKEVEFKFEVDVEFENILEMIAENESSSKDEMQNCEIKNADNEKSEDQSKKD